jgi:RimJ/RimL family protein N-acetyltransferase
METRVERSAVPEVRLRPVRPIDVDRLLAWRAEPATRLHQPLRELTREELLADIRYTSGGRLADRERDRFQWVVEAGEPAGWVTLVIRSWEHLVGEVAYSLSSRHHGKGVGTAAVRRLVSLAFKEGGLYRLEARCSVQNEPSFRLLERLGFTREAVLREYFVIRGERVDHYFYSLLRPEWEGIRGRGTGVRGQR